MRYKRNRFNPWVAKNPWRRARQPTPVFSPGESHGQRSLVAYSLQGRKEADTTEAIQHSTVRSCFRGFPVGSVVENPPANAGDMGSVPGQARSRGEGNGNPLQNILAWEILWTEEPGGYSPWSCKRVRHDLMTKKQHSCLTMLCQFLLYSKVNQLHIYKYSLFFGSPSRLGHRRALSRVSCATSVFSLVIYFIYSTNSVYMPFPISNSSHPSFSLLDPYLCSLCLYFSF